MAAKFTDKEFRYKGFHGCDSHCLISMYEHEVRTVIVCQEADDNEGTSITNMAEHIATYVCRDYEIDMGNMIWIEHYPPRKDSVLRPEPDGSWDLCWFTIVETPARGYWDEPKGKNVFVSPRWFNLAVEIKDQLISGDLDFLKEAINSKGWRHFAADRQEPRKGIF